MPPHNDAASEIVILDPDDTVRIQRFRETGKTILRTLYVGDSSHTFERPETEAYIAQTMTLEQRIAEYKKRKDRDTDEYEYRSAVDKTLLAENASYHEWEAALPTKERLLQAAHDTLADHDSRETGQLVCSTCEGKGSYHQICACTILISSITNIDGLTVSDRDEGTADPLCRECYGAGTVTTDCGRCEGKGSFDLYPQIRIFEPTAGAWHTFRLDAAQLLLQHPDRLRFSTEYWQSSLAGRTSIGANFTACFQLGEAIGDTIGVVRKDDEVVRACFGEGYSLSREFDEFFSSGCERIYSEGWNSYSGKVKSRLRSRNAPPDARDAKALLLDYQETIASRFRADITNWDAPSYHVQYAPTAERRFVDLRSALGAKGLSLAVSQEFIATGETGPSVMAAQGDRMLAVLGQDYTLERAIEGAWQGYLKWAQSLAQDHKRI